MRLTFDIDAKLFRAAMACVGTDEARPYIHGVYLEPTGEKGVNIVSTNGYVMACFHDQTGKVDRPAQLVVDRKVVTDTKWRKADRLIDLGDDDAQLTDAQQDAGLAVFPVSDISKEWTFPAWRNVATPPAGDFTCGWPADYAFYSEPLSRVVEALRWSDAAHDGSPRANVALVPYTKSGDRRIFFTSPTVPGFVVCMPASAGQTVSADHFNMPEEAK